MKETIVSKYHYVALGGIESDKKGNIGRIIPLRNVRGDFFKLVLPNYKSLSNKIYHIIGYDKKNKKMLICDEFGEVKKVSPDRFVFVSDFDRY